MVMVNETTAAILNTTTYLRARDILIVKRDSSYFIYVHSFISRRRVLLVSPGGPGGGGTPIDNRRGCSSKFSKETPRSYHIRCGSSQFYSLKVTSEIFMHRNITGILKIITKGQQVLL